MLDQATIGRIVAEHGYTARIREVVSKRGDGTAHAYAYAWRKRAGKSLGPLSDLERMGEGELRQHVATKLKEKSEE